MHGERIEQAFGDTTYTLFPVHARNDHNNKKINPWINIVCAFSEAALERFSTMPQNPSNSQSILST